MKISAFNANCPFEIGDRVCLTAQGEAKLPIRTITDIVCAHYVKSGAIEFGYELDNNQQYVRLEKCVV